MSTLREKTIGIALVHGKQRDAVARHEPVWLQSCARMVYFSPIDDCLSLPGRVEYSVGRSANYSPHTTQRMREALRFASLSQFSYVYLTEWDSMVFGGFPEQVVKDNKAEVYAPVFHDPENPKFKGKFYLHFPQLYRRVALERLVATMDTLPLDMEGGFGDRVVGYSVAQAGLTVFDMHLTALVYTKNEIGTKELPEALEAYARGANFTHGIKTKDTFEALKKASALYQFNKDEQK